MGCGPATANEENAVSANKDNTNLIKSSSNNQNEPIETKQAKLEDSNMANYGSEEHKQLRKDAAGTEQAWTAMSKGVGVQIWRIEKFKVVPWPKSKYGQFHCGDSYIVLHTMKDPDSDAVKLLYDVFFWLGAETTQDEAGTAAYKTVELDDFLDDEPVQYREVQGNESKAFLDLFPRVQILEGGVDSGFTHVEKETFNDRLLHITGYGQNIQVYQVKVHVNSLNNSDAFILDRGEDANLYQFNGNKANKNEKWRASQIVSDIKSKRGQCELIIVDGLNDKSSDAQQFWTVIGCSDDGVEINDGDGDDDDMEIELVLQKVSNASGHMEVKELARGKTLDKSLLDTKDCFIIDGGKTVFVWCGKKSNKSEKRAAMQNAVDYLKMQGRDLSVPIARVMEGRETKDFWKVFKGEQRGGGRKHMAKTWKSWFQ